MGILGGGGPGSIAAAQVRVDGPLGAIDLQTALNLLAAAGPYFTYAETSPFVLGAPPTYATLKTFTIANGTTRHLDAKILLAGGTVAAPTQATIRILANARRTAAGTTTVPSTSPTIVGSIGGLAVSWAVSGVDVILGLRATGGPTVRAQLFYNWTGELPP